MNWSQIIILAASAALGFAYYRRKRKSSAPAPANDQAQASIEPAAVREIANNGELDDMLEAVRYEMDPRERYHLLDRICDEAYRDRENPASRKIFYRFADQHIAEFEKAADRIREENDGEMPYMSTFKQLAIALDEDERWDEAIDVCRKALGYDLDDRTRTGYGGRIKRIEKKREAARES